MISNAFKKKPPHTGHGSFLKFKSLFARRQATFLPFDLISGEEQEVFLRLTRTFSGIHNSEGFSCAAQGCRCLCIHKFRSAFITVLALRHCACTRETRGNRWDATALTFGMQQRNSTLSELSITCTLKSISGTTDKSPSDGTNNRIRKDGGGRHAALRLGSCLVPH